MSSRIGSVNNGIKNASNSMLVKDFRLPIIRAAIDYLSFSATNILTLYARIYYHPYRCSLAYNWNFPH